MRTSPILRQFGQGVWYGTNVQESVTARRQLRKAITALQPEPEDIQRTRVKSQALLPISTYACTPRHTSWSVMAAPGRSKVLSELIMKSVRGVHRIDRSNHGWLSLLVPVQFVPATSDEGSSSLSEEAVWTRQNHTD
jgi:hypothetical protein